MRLSPRESQILKLMCEGYQPAAMSAQLGITTKTIATLRDRMKVKTGCKTNAQLGIWAVKHGLITLQ